MTGAEEQVRQRFEVMRQVLDERQLRLWAAAEAKSFGYGGGAMVTRATGIRGKRLSKGRRELQELERSPSTDKPREQRVRRPGAGGVPNAWARVAGCRRDQILGRPCGVNAYRSGSASAVCKRPGATYAHAMRLRVGVVLAWVLGLLPSCQGGGDVQLGADCGCGADFCATFFSGPFDASAICNSVDARVPDLACGVELAGGYCTDAGILCCYPQP